ncbi:MAG: CaiB/BaiF CoA-transferase family protein [Gammaproteobacteria bacterium]|jgi:crotonobetainyl-CoA:carnitine CoA-transferase CaiB-like acyl-CoA transferase|uniref:CaiB/BaiF CoA transferase family protein n=1 Tax=Candidatus Njordibacter sp. Uisw_058 TaxID=3230974 RepID=UPI0023A6CDDF|nr:CaiB/BaiF CoA-transferase family protein [Pseudomonadales bacterium]|tara:strand:- start:4900 stop:6108 length:1209 start_codon:yes stop_codon:yes gene_type:complete
MMQTDGPLSGYRVIELGQLLAGPFAGCMLGYFGAEVIKIETPNGGDPIRNWRQMKDGTSLWWYSLARNKKSVTIDLKTKTGIELVKRLINSADIVIENFRPGVVEDWGIGPKEFKQSNPKLVYARISGYGQTGPYASKPGFASVCEGISGFRYVNGHPEQAPVRPNLSIGDTISGIHAALGICLALLEQKTSGTGQVVDVALYESMFNLMEAVVPEYDGANVIRQPSGSTVTGIVPTNTYRCLDGKYVVIGGNGDSIFQRLMTAAGYPAMAQDPALASNSGRVEHEVSIDKALCDWCAANNASHILHILDLNRVPGGPIYNVEDMVADPHFNARGLFENVQINGETLKIPAILPKLDKTPGSTRWPGPELGSHNHHVLNEILGLSEVELTQLAQDGVIQAPN